jgi:UDP-2-acetamido-3-amino-2,3-dideoxy-glucuronate N-acetyltransferase
MNLPRIHPTAILEEGVTLGLGTCIWDAVHIQHGTRIGEECIVGEKTYIAYNVAIGRRVKIGNHVSICTCVTIEDGVLISPGVVFTNDRFPRATTPDLQQVLPSGGDDSMQPTLVKAGASLGAGSVIGNDLTIGRFAMVGLGSVVTRSVPDFHIVMGNPAKSVGGVCRCGQLFTRFTPEQGQVDREQSCPRCGLRYRVTGMTIIELDPPHEPAPRKADESIH